LRWGVVWIPGGALGDLGDGFDDNLWLRSAVTPTGRTCVRKGRSANCRVPQEICSRRRCSDAAPDSDADAGAWLDLRRRLLAVTSDRDGAYPRRRAREANAVDVTFVAPTWRSLTYTARTRPTYVYGSITRRWLCERRDWVRCTVAKNVHVFYGDDSQLVRRLHPLGTWLTPVVERRLQQTWLDCTNAHIAHGLPWSNEWPSYEIQRRGPW